MEWTNVTKTQNEDAWLSDYIADVIAHEPPSFPPHDQKVGHVETHWHQVSPGLVYVAANPEQGSPEDRVFATSLVLAQLAPFGFKQAVYDLPMTKEAGWASPKVMDKAKRLVQTGAVQLDRNSDDIVMARVMGDGTDNDGVPDEHQVEIHKQYPGSSKLTGMFCDCDWGQFLNTPRTRQWKNFQYTPCAHIIATYWSSGSVPTDESRAPGNDPTGGGGQMSLFDMSGGTPGSQMGLMRNSPSPNPNSWFMAPGAQPYAPGQQTPGGGPTGQPQQQAPSPESVLPQFPMDPSLMPQVNPASTPGGRPGPTPTNPLQYPGGTFSHVGAAGDGSAGFGGTGSQQYQNGDIVRLKVQTMGQYEGRPESGMQGQQTDVPAGSMGEVRGTDPTTKMVQVLFMGKQFNEMSFFEPFGASAWCWPSELTPAPQSRPPGPAIRRLY